MTHTVQLSTSMDTLGCSCDRSASPASAFLWRGDHLQQIITANCSYSHILLAGIADLNERSQGLPAHCSCLSASFGKELASAGTPGHAAGEGLLIPWQDSIA